MPKEHSRLYSKLSNSTPHLNEHRAPTCAHLRTFSSSIFSTPGHRYVAASGITQHFETRTRWRNSKQVRSYPVRGPCVPLGYTHTPLFHILLVLRRLFSSAPGGCGAVRHRRSLARFGTNNVAGHVSVGGGLVEKLRNLVSMRHEGDGRRRAETDPRRWRQVALNGRRQIKLDEASVLPSSLSSLLLTQLQTLGLLSMTAPSPRAAATRDRSALLLPNSCLFVRVLLKRSR